MRIILANFLVGVISSNSSAYDYPPYCLKYPFDTDLRASPPLGDQTLARRLKLDQVHLVFRHGMRTVLPTGLCWEHYEPRWDCDYFDTLHGSLVSQSYPSDSETLSLPRLFDIHSTENALGGTCEAGQLLREGAKQHQRIGRLMAENYLIAKSDRKLPYTGSDSLIGPSLKFLSSQLFLRSTDTQRTTDSLLNQLQSMLAHYVRREVLGAAARLPSEISDQSAEADNPKSYPPTPHVWTPEEIAMDLDLNKILKLSLGHISTMDEPFDTMKSNEAMCPLIAEIAKELFASPEYQAVREKGRSAAMRWENVTKLPLKADSWPFRPFDCSHAHVCANRWDNMPEGISPKSNDSVAAGTLLNDIERAATDEYNALYHLQDAVFSRFSMGSFIFDIRDRILRSLEDISNPKRTVLHMWSTHDDGVTPLLAALAPNMTISRWLSYASLVNIEIYRMKNAYRLRLASDKLFPYGESNVDDLMPPDDVFFINGGMINTDSDIITTDDDMDDKIEKNEDKLHDEMDKEADKDFVPPHPGYFIRFVFNGEVITPHIMGCKDELCPLDDFLNATKWADDVNRMCSDSRHEAHASYIGRPNRPYPWPPVDSDHDTLGKPPSMVAALLFAPKDIIVWILVCLTISCLCYLLATLLTRFIKPTSTTTNDLSLLEHLNNGLENGTPLIILEDQRIVRRQI